MERKETKTVKDEQTAKIEEEIRHHEMEILALDMLKQEYTNKVLRQIMRKRNSWHGNQGF